MNEEEAKLLSEMKPRINIYRGYIPGLNKTGLSYSISRKKAEWFANRFNKKGEVVNRIILKQDVFAFVNTRGESEIITLKKSFQKQRKPYKLK